ncbi:MAG TPA: hypothetical protein VHB21_26090 [Minicystis sp.]|nr:hypothetical protein [Minicystis sp.]
MHRLLLAAPFLFAAACGGRVVVDHGSGGAGGSGPGPSVGSPSSTSVGTAVSSSSSGPGSSSSAVSTGTGGGVPSCDALGYVAVGLACAPEGQVCAMQGACCGVEIVCKGGVWAATPPTCDKTCLDCGDGLTCDPTSLCIQDQVHDIQMGVRCAPDPCPLGTPPSCTCAGQLCSNDFLICIGPIDPETLGCTDGTQ